MLQKINTICWFFLDRRNRFVTERKFAALFARKTDARWLKTNHD